MYLYRVVLDAFNSRDPGVRGARVATYTRGIDRDDALRRLRTVYVASNGTVSDGINPWPGTDSMGPGVTGRSLPEYDVVSMRSVKRAGTPRVLAEALLPVPADFPVRVLGPDENPPGRTECGECGRAWDDSITTGWTPVPAARCPFEYFH